VWRYEPPLQDIRFVIEELLDAPQQWAGIEAWLLPEIDWRLRRVQAGDAPLPWGPT